MQPFSLYFHRIVILYTLKQILRHGFSTSKIAHIDAIKCKKHQMYLKIYTSCSNWKHPTISLIFTYLQRADRFCGTLTFGPSSLNDTWATLASLRPCFFRRVVHGLVLCPPCLARFRPLQSLIPAGSDRFLIKIVRIKSIASSH